MFQKQAPSCVPALKRRSKTVLSSVLGKARSLTHLDSDFLLMDTSFPFVLELFSVFTLVGVFVPLDPALDAADFDACWLELLFVVPDL